MFECSKGELKVIISFHTNSFIGIVLTSLLAKDKKSLTLSLLKSVNL